MSWIKKIKLFFMARKPAMKVVNQLKKIKRGYKTWEFWLSLLGALGSLAAAVAGYLDPEVATIVTAGIAGVYNIIRGLKKADEDGIRPSLRSTEFYIGILAILQNALMEMQGKGVDGEWLALALAIVAGSMSVAQNLGASQPEDEIE